MFMKNNTTLRIILAASLFALAGAFAVSPARAEDAPKKEKKVSKKILEKYDLNHNGILDPEEEAALKADRDKARAEKLQQKKDAAAKDKPGEPEKEDETGPN